MPLTDTPAIPSPPRDLALGAGLQLHYVAQGDPDGPVVLLLHGFSDSWHSWDRLLPCLPSELRVLAPTQRGHGDSARPPGGYGIEQMANDAGRFLDALGVQRVSLVGHSMGAAVAQRLAARQPERIERLVLVGGFASFADNAGILGLRDEIEGLSDPVGEDYARAFQESTLAQPVPPAFLATVVAECRKAPKRVWRDAAQGMIDADLAADWPAIACPTLLAWGDRDCFVPAADQQRLQAAIAGSRLRVFPAVGHAPHWEVPEEVAQVLVDFLPAAA